MFFYQILAYTIHKKSYKNNELKILAPTWNDKVELTNGSYSESYIQFFFQHIIKKHETVTDNLPIKTYVNKIGNRITFKVETGYYVELKW